jgi:hypothetical protein
MSRFRLLGGAVTPAASAGMDSGVVHLDLKGTAGFLVADAQGRVVGRVEGPMDGCSADTPDALSVRFSLLRWRRLLVPAATIAGIDDRAQVIGLCVDRDAIRAFL